AVRAALASSRSGSREPQFAQASGPLDHRPFLRRVDQLPLQGTQGPIIQPEPVPIPQEGRELAEMQEPGWAGLWQPNQPFSVTRTASSPGPNCSAQYQGLKSRSPVVIEGVRPVFETWEGRRAARTLPGRGVGTRARAGRIAAPE